MSFQTLLVETAEGVTLIRLNRPEALNALNTRLLEELGQALDAAEADRAVGCVVITGSEKAFAAGADIKEMTDKDYPEMFLTDFFGKGDKDCRYDRFTMSGGTIDAEATCTADGRTRTMSIKGTYSADSYNIVAEANGDAAQPMHMKMTTDAKHTGACRGTEDKE